MSTNFLRPTGTLIVAFSLIVGSLSVATASDIVVDHESNIDTGGGEGGSAATPRYQDAWVGLSMSDNTRLGSARAAAGASGLAR